MILNELNEMSFSMVETTFSVTDVVKGAPRYLQQLKTCPTPRSGVIAAETIKQGVVSKPFSISELASCRTGECSKNIHMRISSLGYMEIDPPTMNHPSRVWKYLPNLAPDIHSCNIQLEINHSHATHLEKNLNFFLLKVTKDVAKGAELLLWFSEEILAIVAMPFLIPKNITGHKKYSCHLCNEFFEYPNPLKIHLLLSCEREAMSQLWKKIAKVLWMQNTGLNLRLDSRYSDQQCSSSERPNSVNVLPASVKIEQDLRCISEPPISAFLPYNKISHLQQSNLGTNKIFKSESLPISIQPLNLTTSTASNLSLKINSSQQPWINNILEMRLSRSLDELSSNYAADVELFASNWGKLKQGHLCVYCGKVYSRKYGLKIHIRTHTGYKPLKCKFCQRPFGDPSNLNKHVRLHASGLTPYMCSLCGKVLVRRRDLERHMKSQHGSEDVCSSDDNIDIDND